MLKQIYYLHAYVTTDTKPIGKKSIITVWDRADRLSVGYKQESG